MRYFFYAATLRNVLKRNLILQENCTNDINSENLVKIRRKFQNQPGGRGSEQPGNDVT